MKIIFSGSELVELGIQIEKNGRDFYSVLSRQSQDDKAKKTFEFLSKKEEKHISVFQKILDSAHSYEPRESYPDEYFAYMNTLAGEYIFTQADKGGEIARKIKNDDETLSMGIQFEKNSILFEPVAKCLLIHRRCPVDGYFPNFSRWFSSRLLSRFRSEGVLQQPLFYEGMKNIMAQADYPIIEELIRQEHKHLMQLSELKKS